jgi:hypothetical protein
VILVTVSLEDRIFNLLDLVVFRTERLQRVDSVKDELNDAILLKFASPDNLRTNKENKEGKSFVGNFKTKNSKHLISGLDREKVCGCLLEGYVVLDPDEFSWGGREYAPPFDVISVFPLRLTFVDDVDITEVKRGGYVPSNANTIQNPT